VPDLSWTRPRRPVRTGLDEVAEWLGVPAPDGADDVVVTGLSLSSQRVAPGDLYAALPGARAHGAAYADDAVAAGAVAVLTDADGAARVTRAPALVVERPRAVLGDLAARVYGNPAEHLTLLAVTGTQGKTTTTRLAERRANTNGHNRASTGA